MKTVLGLNADEARKYFLEQDSYCNFDLPPYFQFSKLLSAISSEIKEKEISGYYSAKKPKEFEGVNYDLLNNKDGKYSWRRLQLIHPILYVALVHKITTEENWLFLKSRFESFSDNKYVDCVSIPALANKKTKKEKQILQWWEHVEQKTIELSLSFEFLYHTDIANCYSSIYTHSIPWALHSKTVAKEERENKSLLGNNIDFFIQSMSNGQTNGIPEGSILMDFIAEIVLGYADELLSQKLLEHKVKQKDCSIIRYRDDYRILVNDQSIGDIVIKSLMEVLMDLGLRLNKSKTSSTPNIIVGALKEDKYDWINQDIIPENFSKKLLVIHGFSMKHPNSGTLSKMLQNFYQEIESLSPSQIEPRILASIATDIGLKNPRTYPIISAILSKVIAVTPQRKRKPFLERVVNKFQKMPNTSYLEIWLQRATTKFENKIQPKSLICKLVRNNDNIQIWNSDWLKSTSKLNNIVLRHPIYDETKYQEMKPVIDSTEVSIFLY